VGLARRQPSRGRHRKLSRSLTSQEFKNPRPGHIPTPPRPRPVRARPAIPQWLAATFCGERRNITVDLEPEPINLGRTADVRFGANAGLSSDLVPCPKSARTGSGRSHSITSSARASKVGGMVRPSAFAVLRLMTRRKWVLCWTGISDGRSPLRTRPAYSPIIRYSSCRKNP
jgi:hypothetical protein